MRKRYIALGAGASVVGVLALTVLVGPSLFRGQLTTRAERAVSKALGAEVTVERADVGLLWSFPRADVRLHGVRVEGTAPFTDVPFLTAEGIGVSFDLIDVLRGDYTARGVHLDTPHIHAVAGADGATNFDFGGETAQAEPASGDDVAVRLDKVLVEDMQVVWTDMEGAMEVRLDDIDLEGRGDVTGETVAFASSTQVAELIVTSEAETWVHELTLAVRGEVVYRMTDGGIELKGMTGALNELPIALDATATPQGDDWLLSAKLDAPNATAEGLISLIPVAWRGPTEAMDATGAVEIAATIEGVYASAGESYPALEARVKLTDGTFHSGDLPETITALQLDLGISHPQGPLEQTSVALDRAGFRIGASSFETSGRIDEAMGDPLLDLVVKGDLDLATVQKAAPIEGFAGEGALALDLDVKARQSALTAPDPAGIELTGTMVARDLTLELDSMPDPLIVKTANLTFAPAQTTIEPYAVTFGSSDMQGTARLENLLGYGMAGGVLKGAVVARSTKLDMVPFMADDPAAAPAPEAAPAGVVQVPPELDLDIDLQADRVELGGWAITGLAGHVLLDQGTLGLRDLGADIAGGRATVTGTYAPESSARAALDMNVQATDLGATEARETFTTIARVVPAFVELAGRFDARLDVKGALDASMALVPDSLTSDGTITGRGLGMEAEVLEPAATQLRQPGLSKLSLGTGALAYTVREGRMNLAPVPVKLGGLAATAGGSVGLLDQSLDLALDSSIPTTGLDTSLLGAYGAAVPKQVPVGLTVTGTALAPKLGVDLAPAGDLVKDAVKGALDAAKAEVGAKVTEATDAWLASAQAEADKIVADAEKEAAKLRRQAKKEADALIAKAGDNPLLVAGAKKAADKLIKESEKAEQKLIRDARTRADASIAKAKKERDAAIR